MNRTGRSRRLAILVVAVVAMAGLLTLVGGGSAGAAASIDDFAVYGENGVHIGYGTKVSGLVGARADRTELPYPHSAISLAGTSKVTGEVRSGANVEMANQTAIDGPLTYVGALVRSSSSTITGPISKAANADAAGLPSGPIPSQWPGAATYCATDHGPDRSLPNNKTITLTPGTWGTIVAGTNTRLIFDGAGDYYIDRLQTGNVSISYPPGVRLFVCNKLQFAAVLNGMPASPIYTEVAAIPEDADHHGFEVANGPWKGDVVVPTAGMHYGTGSSERATYRGRVWAEHVDLEHNVDAVGPPPPPSSTTTTSTSTTVPPTVPPTTPPTNPTTTSTFDP